MDLRSYRELWGLGYAPISLTLRSGLSLSRLTRKIWLTALRIFPFALEDHGADPW
jgi:hypothetical protein